MKTFSRTSTLLILIALIVAPAAFAQVPLPEKTTTWTISEPTLVGETVLQPGTYSIAVVPRSTDRNIVRVLSTDGQTLYATVLTVPHTLDPDEQRPSSMFVYYPALPGEPRALRTWFPADPPSGDGHDIVYDEDRARMLARASSTTVVSYPAHTEVAQLETVEIHRIEPEVTTTSVTRTETTTTTPVTTTETERTLVAETRTELPQTAGSTPLLALLGMLSIAGALVIRAAIR
ncbi:MAG TPA: hypothetical protein VGF40_15280 [Thermoanaerobaculia bacterium]